MVLGTTNRIDVGQHLPGEREHEMETDVVSLLYIAPAVNSEFMGRVTSLELRSLGSDIHDV